MNAIMSGGVQIRTRGVFVKTLLYYYEAMNTIMSGVYRYFGACLRHTVFFKEGGLFWGCVCSCLQRSEFYNHELFDTYLATHMLK